MTQDTPSQIKLTPQRRPKAFPPPEFPPRKPKLFARTPPALFPSILGLLGLGIALRRGFAVLALPGGVVELLLGCLLGLWAFAVVALLGKIARRPAVVLEELKTLPGRAGYATAAMSVMVVAMVLVPYSAVVAGALVYLSLAIHLGLAVLMIWVMMAAPPEMRMVTPIWHLSFVGFIVAAVPAAQLGMVDLAQAVLWATIPMAVAIWAISLTQLIKRIPPAPLRPLLAIHLSPAALFVTVAVLLGQVALAQGFALLGVVILAGLIGFGRWITAAGFSAFWGAFTFPLAAFASALLTLGGVAEPLGLLVLLAALGLVPMIALRVIKMWPAGKLAAKTGAIEA